MDLAQPINHNVLVEHEGFSFLSDIKYENLQDFWTHCRKIGHNVQACKLRKTNTQPIPKPKTTFVQNSSSKPLEDVVAQCLNGSQRREQSPHRNAILEIEQTMHIVDSSLVPLNPLNFVSHPLEDSESQLSLFVESTQAIEVKGK